MGKLKQYHTASGVSFFQKKDKILTRRVGGTETFESPKREIENLGQISLLFSRFDPGDARLMYGASENTYTIDKLGKFSIAKARALPASQLFEVTVLLRTMKKIEEDQMICNLWMKNSEPVFSTYLDLRHNESNHSSLFVGGYIWWSSKQLDKNIKKLQLSDNINLLSNLCLNIQSLSRQFPKKDIEDEIDFDDMLYW